MTNPGTPPPNYPPAPSAGGYPYPPPQPPLPPDPHIADASSKKMAAGLCGILLGALGIHKFILGYTTAGVIMLLVSILSCGIAAGIMHIIGLIEGIMYITKSDAEFYQTYIANKKEWF